MERQLISALILSIVACTGMVSAQELKGPKIEVREMQHDFGKVTQGQQTDHVFTVRNAGNEPLTIERVVPS